MLTKIAGILDPIKDTLPKDIWLNTGILRPEIKEQVLDRLHKLVGHHYVQVVLIGSTNLSILS